MSQHGQICLVRKAAPVGTLPLVSFGERAMAGIDWKLEQDRRAITITFPTDPGLRLTLSVERVDEVLRILGFLRSHMEPEIERQFAPAQKAEGISHPIWMTEPDALGGESLLHIRDPRYGWLHYLIPSDEAKKLADLFRAQAEIGP